MAENKHEENEKTDATDAQGQALSRIFRAQDKPKSQTHETTKSDNKPNTNKRERFREFLERWKVLLQLIVPSIFSLGVLVVIGVQAWIYSDQLEQMKKATKATRRAADAAKISSDAAKQSVTLARQNARVDQRAWVAVAGIAGIPTTGQILKISVGVRNTGKTFAKNVTMHQVAETIPKGQEPNFDWEENEAMFPDLVSKFIIAPTDVYVIDNYLRPYRKLEPSEIESINSGDTLIFVHGKITYDDVFGCNHWTTYCYFFNRANNGYSPYEKHNTPDDNLCP
jgi:hypothetical protein